MKQLQNQDQMFLDYIKQNKHIGYGRMMSIISHLWYLELDKEGLGSGAFDTVCVGSLSKKDKNEYLKMLEQDKKYLDYSLESK